MSMRVGIYLYPDAEVLDFAGPYEVFTTASRLFGRENPEAPPPFSVFSVARVPGTVRARAGLLVEPDYHLGDHPPIDLLLVPGGVVAAELANPTVASWIGQMATHATLTASVCTGAFLLAEAGLLDQRSATTHWEDIAEMREMFPEVSVLGGRRWVDEGAVVTSAGISAGIDMCLHLVARFAGRELALRTARQLDFDWRQN